jgi:TRAP-type C4-dicarboxylate transport system substrate-binding protein
MKNLLQKNIITIASSLFLTSSLFAIEQPITLTFHHFLSPKAPPHTEIFEPWARHVEELSKGKLKVEIFPSMTMGGKPNELYNQVRDGSADIVFTIAGYSPGIFPRSEVFELPTMQANNSLNTALVIKENFDLIKDDFSEVKPILVGVAGSYLLHNVDKKVEKLSDLKGLKLRSPSRTGAWYIEALGAEPVGMPLPDVPQALSKNAIDGAVLPMEIFPPYKIQQLTKYSIELQNGGGFGNSVAVILMNKKRFDSLPKELQDVIEKSAGLDLIEKYGQLMIDLEQPGKDLQVKSGGEIITLSKESSEEFNEVGKKVVKRWVKEINDKGIDGQKIVDAVRASIDKKD